MARIARENRKKRLTIMLSRGKKRGVNRKLIMPYVHHIINRTKRKRNKCHRLGWWINVWQLKSWQKKMSRKTETRKKLYEKRFCSHPCTTKAGEEKREMKFFLLSNSPPNIGDFSTATKVSEWKTSSFIPPIVACCRDAAREKRNILCQGEFCRRL